MSLTRDERVAIASEKVRQLRTELSELGFESSFFFRAPGSAKDPVGYLLFGETPDDVEQARSDKRV